MDTEPPQRHQRRAGADEIPEVDLSQPAGDSAAAEQLVCALTTVGFCYVAGHDIPPEAISAAFDESAGFFSLSLAEKLRHRRDWRTEHCGYIPLHRAIADEGEAGLAVERFSLTSPPDEKEVLDVCHGCSAWSSDHFRSVCLNLIAAAQALTVRLMRLIGLGLGLSPPDQLAAAFAGFATPGNTSQLRLLHYPPLHTEAAGDRCCEHTDYGCLTLVFCDSQPGLQVLSRSGHFLNANPRPGRVLINIGDLMQRWTGGRLRSARHRVVAPADPEFRAQSRYSLVYFTHCDDDHIVRPVLGDLASFPPVKTSEHFRRRFEETFVHGKGVDPQLPQP